MVDAALIRECADPALKPAIVEKFLEKVGTADPLAVSIRAGNRVILVPPPKAPDEALALVRRWVGEAEVRVGVTRFPAGVGVKDPSEIGADLFEPSTAEFHLQLLEGQSGEAQVGPERVQVVSIDWKWEVFCISG